MKENLNQIVKAILSGILVGIGGILYVSASNQIVGSVLFSFALILIVERGYNLFTGKVGYMLPYQKGQFKLLMQTLLGNIIGILFAAGLFLLSGKDGAMIHATEIFELKLTQVWYETLVLAIFCGFMMYLAVDSYHKLKNPGAALLVVIFAVSIFIVAGFEHSIADMSYLVLSKTFTLEAFLFILIVLIGNMIGAVILNLLNHYIKSA